MLTSVLIPCWNALDMTQICLRQLLRWTTGPFEIIAVDNGSTDGTGAWLEAFRERSLRAVGALRGMLVIRNRRNAGYPAAMNQGLAAASGRRLLLGNSDAAVASDWLEAMSEALDSSPAIGAVAPSSNPPRRPGAPALWAAPPWYRGLRGLERFAAACRLKASSPAFLPARGFIPGFWFLTRRSVIEKVGGFDERFSPASFEDWDLQWRMRLAGLRLGFAPRAFVHHIGFGSGERNGLRITDRFGTRKRLLLSRKFPETAAMTLTAHGPP